MPNNANDNPSPPLSWSEEVRDLFVPVRSLGIGGFGSVWLARKKNSTVEEQYIDSEKKEEDNLVAIKVVGHPHNQKISSFEKLSEEGYFQREVSVLQQISHPRIVQCLETFEDKDPNSPHAPFCLVLEYCRGPTVHQLLKYRGALGISMAQEVCSQLIDAISYLHGRAVIHRDIKPDNIIVEGAKYRDDACWSDGIDGDEAAKSMRWNIRLVDFGFARPLRPDDILNKESLLQKKKEPRNAEFFGKSTVDNRLDDRSLHQSGLGLDLSRSAGGTKQELDLSNSISRYKIMDLSAVGNRNFAAPEIMKGIHVFKRNKDTEGHDPLTRHVSDYGMIVDAFSTGATIRNICTGVPPHTSVEEFIAAKTSCEKVLCRKIKAAMKKTDTKPMKRYRSNDDLPAEAVRLILGLTHWNEKKRTTVRSARAYEWIVSSYSMKKQPTQSKSSEKLDFLKFTGVR